MSKLTAAMLFPCVLAASSVSGLEKPEALVQAQAARQATWLLTAHIEWSLWESDASQTMPPRTRFFTWKCAGDTYLNVKRGDEEGIVQRGPDGEPAQITYDGPVHTLMRDGQVWRHVERSPGAHVWEEERAQFFNLYDLRRMGLNPVSKDADLDETCRALGRPPLRYESSTEDGLSVVTGFTDGGKFKWWIDPHKDWNVVKTAVFQNGKQIGETRYTLRRFDGIWFADRMEHFRLAAGDTEPSTVLEILWAEFNRPEHPHELTPADIGIEVGTSLRFMDRTPPSGGYWDGENVTTWDDLFERLQSGELTMGSTRQREMARLRALRDGTELPTDGPVATAQEAQPLAWKLIRKTVESEWEAYTRRFIARYRLNDEQTEKALTILRDCQKRANQYLEKRKTQFEKLETRRKTARQSQKKETAKELAAIEAKLKKLRQPIGEIFEKQLKPRLNKLPTRRQRQAAEEREAAKQAPQSKPKPKD